MNQRKSLLRGAPLVGGRETHSCAERTPSLFGGPGPVPGTGEDAVKSHSKTACPHGACVLGK